MKLSIVMPVYNEAATVTEVVKRVLDTPFPCDIEVLIVDDGSSDGTSELISELDDYRITAFLHEQNRGKGQAVRTAVGNATGEYMIICDGDGEAQPEQIPLLLDPVLKGEAQVVYGTRRFSSHNAFSFWYVLGNKFVTFFANFLFNSWISDLETCFKLLPVDLYKALGIRSHGFGMEAEVTGKLLRSRHTIFEVPVDYRPRAREDGKKLTWLDGVGALLILSKIRLTPAKRLNLDRARPQYRPWI